MRRAALNLFAFACTIAAPHLSRAQVTCPANLAVEQRASAPAPDWTVGYSGYNTALEGVTIFDGPPVEQASLIPDREETTNDSVFQSWTLQKNARGYWLQCSYANTTVQISRALPVNVSRCVVSYERNVRFGPDGRRVVRRATCE